MIDRAALILGGSFLITFGIAWAVEPVRLLASIIAVAVVWVMITVAVLAARVAVHI
jgi:hypothetical protein